jgi:hypothetical protein
LKIQPLVTGNGDCTTSVRAGTGLKLENDAYEFIDKSPSELFGPSDVSVGNDSDPKHLAALRGAKVVSIHSARINWNEMGQEISGTIISRKVPCAGCGIDHDADECGKDFACIVKISPEEVFDSVMTPL